MKRIRGGTFFASMERCSPKSWPEVNSKVHVSKACFLVLWGRPVTWLTRTEVRKVRYPQGEFHRYQSWYLATLPFYALLSFFTSNLGTLHCLRQVLFSFSKFTHFAKHVMGMKQIILFKRCCICGSSVHRIAGYHTTMWTKLNSFWKFAIVIIR